jgi:hypothetical protein
MRKMGAQAGTEGLARAGLPGQLSVRDTNPVARRARHVENGIRVRVGAA